MAAASAFCPGPACPSVRFPIPAPVKSLNPDAGPVAFAALLPAAAPFPEEEPPPEPLPEWEPPLYV